MTGGHLDKTYIPLASINIFVLVFLVLGFILDLNGKCTVDPNNKIKKDIRLPEATGAAAAEND